MPEVDIPEEYYEKFAERAPDKGFDSADEYVNYVLGQVYEKLQDQKSEGTTYSKEEEEKVKERLKGLGYLD